MNKGVYFARPNIVFLTKPNKSRHVVEAYDVTLELRTDQMKCRQDQLQALSILQSGP